MRNYQSEIAGRKSESDKENHPRNGHNDFAVDNGQLIDALNDSPRFGFKTINADCRKRAEYGGNNAGYDCNNKGVFQCRKQFPSFSSLAKIAIASKLKPLSTVKARY